MLSGQFLQLIETGNAKSGNTDCGEMIWFDDRSEDGIKTFADCSIECLKEPLANIRVLKGGILGFLFDQRCNPDLIENIITDQKNR